MKAPTRLGRINISLLTEVMVKIRREPDSHRQDTWGMKTPCGTTMCIAGHTAIMAGAVPQWVKSSSERSGLKMFMGEVITPEGYLVGVSDYAKEMLGMEHGDAYALFMTMSHPEMWRTLAEITRGLVTLKKIDAIIAEQDAAMVAAEPIRTVVKHKPKELVS